MKTLYFLYFAALVIPSLFVSLCSFSIYQQCGLLSASVCSLYCKLLCYFCSFSLFYLTELNCVPALWLLILSLSQLLTVFSAMKSPLCSFQSVVSILYSLYCHLCLIVSTLLSLTYCGVSVTFPLICSLLSAILFHKIHLYEGMGLLKGTVA